MASLPNELYSRIFIQSSIFDFISFRLISSNFNQLITYIIYPVQITLKRINSIPKNIVNICCIPLESEEYSKLSYLLHVNHLVFSSLNITSVQFLIFREFKNLQSIDLSHSNVDSFDLTSLYDLKNLKSVNLEHCIQVDSRTLLCLRNSTDLEELNISGNWMHYKEIIRDLSNTKITRLNIRDCEIGTDEYLDEDCNELGKRFRLKYLNVGYQYFSTKSLSSNLISLEELHVKCENVKQELIDSISRLTNLKKLSIKYQTIESNINLDRLKYIEDIQIFH